MNNINSDIILLGPYPPPYGGVSMHVKRLADKLNEIGVRNTVHDYSSSAVINDNIVPVNSRVIWFFRQLFSKSIDIIHCHGYEAMATIALSILSVLRHRRVIITPHGFLFPISSAIPWIDKFSLWLAIKTKIHFILGDSAMEQSVHHWIEYGADSHQLLTLSSFIAPVEQDEDADAIPAQIWDFARKHKPTISANGYKIVFYNGVDLYGIDMCVELCHMLKNSYSEIGIIFFLPDIGDFEYFNELNRRIKEKNIQDNFMFVNEKYQFYPILKISDIFIRPTCIDGASLSVPEALNYRVPAIASDVCSRADGTIIFRNRNLRDLADKVIDVWDNYAEYKERLEKIKIPEAFNEILGLYEHVSKM